IFDVDPHISGTLLDSTKPRLALPRADPIRQEVRVNTRRVAGNDGDFTRYVPARHLRGGNAYPAKRATDINKHFATPEHGAAKFFGQRGLDSLHPICVDAKPTNVTRAQTRNASWNLYAELDDTICNDP